MFTNLRLQTANSPSQAIRMMKAITARRKTIFRRLKHSARHRGIYYDLKYKDLIWPSHCPLLGIRLEYDKLYGHSWAAPSIDRIDNSLGYVAGNVWVISKKANTMKNCASLEELKLFSENILEKLKDRFV